MQISDDELLKIALALTPEERIIESEKLYEEALLINPQKGKPFWKSFNSFDEFEKWKRKQRDPWLW